MCFLPASVILACRGQVTLVLPAQFRHGESRVGIERGSMARSALADAALNKFGGSNGFDDV
jgi:hypothetical protein